MSGEDVYDVAAPLWCDICQEAHRSCEDPDDFDLRTQPDPSSPENTDSS